ncbi:MAG: tetratricopeptide repeat protein [Chloroflexota bacterium]
MADKQITFEQALSRGHSFSFDQKWEEAIRAFELARKLSPQEPAPYAGLGDAYLELNQLAKALENYKLAARQANSNVIYLRRVADVQERLGQQVEAGKTYMAIGELALSRRDLNEAMDNWHRAIRLEPNLLRAHQRLASIYERQGAIRNAIREYLAVARILQLQQENEHALRACQMALRLDPRNAEVLTAIERIKQGEMLAATDGLGISDQGVGEAVRRKAIEMEGLEEGWEEDRRGETETAVPVQDAKRMALEQLAETLFSDSDDSDLDQKEQASLISKALDNQTRGLINEAISAYEQVIKMGVDSTAVHFNLGLLYQDKLRFEDAIGRFEIAIKDPEYRLASHFALGESYRARGRIDKAIENFIAVLRIVDLRTVRHDQADRLIELYENLYDGLITKGERDQASAFANSLVEFLGHKGWEDKVNEARRRLDAISNTGMMILGDVLTAGSQHVLESLYLSQEYARRSMYSAAVEETYRAIQLAPEYLPAHIQLGDVLGQQGRRDAAAEKFTTIANTYRVRGDMNGAIIAYEKVVEFSPMDLSIRARLIDMLKRHGQIDRSLEHYMAMGEVYYQLAQVDNAREAYQNALKLAPRGSAEHNWRHRFLLLLADIDMQRFDWWRALAAYKELRELEPEDERTAITLVDLYYKVGQPNNAVRELDNYLVQLVRSKRGGKVVGILEDMVEQRPSDPNLVDRLCRLYMQQARSEEAIFLLDRLGEMQLEEGDNVGAVKTISKILQFNPSNSESYEQLLAQLRS